MQVKLIRFQITLVLKAMLMSRKGFLDYWEIYTWKHLHLLTIRSLTIAWDYFKVSMLNWELLEVEPTEKHAHIEPHPCNCFMTIWTESTAWSNEKYSTIISQISKIYSRKVDVDSARWIMLSEHKTDKKVKNQSKCELKKCYSLSILNE